MQRNDEGIQCNNDDDRWEEIQYNNMSKRYNRSTWVRDTIQQHEQEIQYNNMRKRYNTTTWARDTIQQRRQRQRGRHNGNLEGLPGGGAEPPSTLGGLFRPVCGGRGRGGGWHVAWHLTVAWSLCDALAGLVWACGGSMNLKW